MDEFSTIEEIEANLRFCEDVLSSSARKQPAQQCPVSNAGMAIGRGAPAANGLRAAARGPAWQPQVLPQHKLQQLQPGSQDTTPRKHLLQSSHSKPVQQPAAASTKARTTEELLAMLSNVPEGQPFEIDTHLLYSPQSSFAGGRHGSPSARSCSHESLAGDDQFDLQLQRPHTDAGGIADAQFSLPAYRSSTGGCQPLFANIGQAATALSPLPGGTHVTAAGSHRSQQHAAGPPPNSQQPQTRHSRGTRAGRSPGVSVRSQNSGPRHASTPQHSADGSSSRRPGRQLRLDDALSPGGIQGSTAELLQEPRGQRIAQLAQPRVGLWQQCARIKVQAEVAQLQECTFKPKTGRPPKQHRMAAGLSVEERLQLSQAGRQEALERARVEKEREQLADCTFAPQLVTLPERHLREDYKPLHRRVGQEQKRRSSKMAEAQFRRNLGDADLTFQPQLNQRSLQLAAEREEREMLQEQPAAGGAAWRLSSAGLVRSCAEVDGNLTFSPSINPASERLLEDSATVPTDFQERLRYYSMRKQLRQQAASEAADADSCTFRPDTGNAVQVLALSASRAGNLLETEEERYGRLAGDEAAKLAARRAAKEAEVYGGLQFKPQLNARSVAMAPTGSGGIEGLASMADRQRQRLAELRQAEEERLLSQCTFQPDTSKPRVRGYYDEYQPPRANAPISIASAAKQGFEGLTQRIADYQAEKEARAAAIKAEHQVKQLAQCSFAPDINRRGVEGKGPVVVRGLERYWELKQLAERQKAEAEERAAKVFHTNPRAKQGATVPQPFHLAGHALLEAKAAEKQAALLESALCERMRDCTFHPQTNATRRQEQLQRILGQPLEEILAATAE